MFAPTSAIENTSSSSLTIRRKLSSLVSCKFSSREIFIFQSRHFTPCTRIWRSGTTFLVSCHSAVSPRASALAVWSFRCRNESLCECTTSLRFSVHFQSRILRFCKFATSLRYFIVADFHVLPFHTLNPFCSVPAWSSSLSKIFPFRRVRHLAPFSM